MRQGLHHHPSTFLSAPAGGKRVPINPNGSSHGAPAGRGPRWPQQDRDTPGGTVRAPWGAERDQALSSELLQTSVPAEGARPKALASKAAALKLTGQGRQGVLGGSSVPGAWVSLGCGFWGVPRPFQPGGVALDQHQGPHAGGKRCHFLCPFYRRETGLGKGVAWGKVARPMFTVACQGWGAGGVTWHLQGLWAAECPGCILDTPRSICAVLGGSGHGERAR